MAVRVVSLPATANKMKNGALGQPPTRSIDAGTITITAVQTEEAGNARDINFDPTVLPDGITVSDDPLLAARSAVYARSFTRRAEEPKSPSEVNVHQVLS